VTGRSAIGDSKEVFPRGGSFPFGLGKFVDGEVMILRILSFEWFLIGIGLSACFGDIACDIIGSFDVERTGLLFFLVLKVGS
jgi:hypothetical protein